MADKNIKLEDLLREYPSVIHGEIFGLTVRDICSDSREVTTDTLFCAIVGEKINGMLYAKAAVEAGAAALVVQNGADFSEIINVPVIVVEDVRKFYSFACARFFGEPSLRQRVIGVTGTNGKSTTHYICSSLLSALRTRNLRIGTLGIFSESLVQRESLTTPDAKELQSVMSETLQAQVEHVAMEVSSHALCQERVADVHFDVVVFTNLTRDHLDYHKSVEDYFAAKRHLFELLNSSKKTHKSGIICVDSEYGQKLLTDFRMGVDFSLETYGFSTIADWQILNFAQESAGSTFDLVNRRLNFSISIQSSYIAEYNALNLTAALLSMRALGFDLKKVAALAAQLPQTPGRLESCGQDGVAVFVDYAHTPDALEKALSSLRPLCNKGEKLGVVFGCGGDRDRGKRPLMGQIAKQLADRVIVTSDNPRTEDPQQIIADILSANIQPDVCAVDRAEAIRAALDLCQSGDVLLIAGKGHEDYQIIGTQKLHFSDQEQVHNYFKQRLEVR